MKFKNKADNEIFMIMSEKEVEKYPDFKKENVVVESGLARTITDGAYELVINGVRVELVIAIETLEKGNFKASVKANSYWFDIFKNREIRKYDIYRSIVQNWDKVKGQL